jgi:hypothetical protein
MLETAPGTELAEIVTVAAWPIPVYVCGEFDIAKVAVGVALFTVKSYSSTRPYNCHLHYKTLMAYGEEPNIK